MSNTNTPVRISLLLTGVIMMILSLLVLQRLPLDQRNQVVWLLLLGIGLFLAAAVTAMKSTENPSGMERIARRIADWFHVRDWQVLLLLASPLFSWMAWRAAGEGELMVGPVVAILAWVLAIAAAIVGSVQISREGMKVRVHDLILPILLTLIAFLIRGVAMDRFPILLTGDEGSAGITAARVLEGKLDNPFISTGYSFPSLYYLLQSLPILLFGRTTAALRLTSAIAGALTVMAVFYVGSMMFDRRSGLLAAIFLAAYNFHIHFSRIGLNNIWDGLWYTIFIGALWHGWVRHQNRSFVLAGAALGIAQYFYPSGRALIIPILGWLVLMGLFNRERFRKIFPGLVIMFIVALVIILPLAIFYVHHPAEYMAPFRRVSIFGYILDGMVQSTGQPVWLILLKQIWLGLQAFIYRPVTFWYQSGAPLLRPVAASLFLIGLLLLLSRGRDSRFLLLLLWVLTFGLIGGLSESTPAAQRYVAAAPVCALLVGYGLSRLISIFEDFWPQHRRILGGVAITLAVLLAVDELYFYFQTYTQKSVRDWSQSNTMVAQHLAEYLSEKPSEWQVVFMGAPRMGYYSIPSLQYLVPNIRGVDATLPWQSFDKSAITGTNLVFVMLPGNEVALEAIKVDYPGGQTYTELASDGQPLYWYYESTAR